MEPRLSGLPKYINHLRIFVIILGTVFRVKNTL